MTWHDGRAYGVTYRTLPGDASEWALTLVSSADGRVFDRVTALSVPGRPNETTLRFMPDGEMVALVRREAGDRLAWVGRSRAPYTTWTWRETPHQVGGPEFHPPAGRRIVGLGPQLSRWTEDSRRAHDPRWRLRPGAHAAVRGRHQLRWHGVARGSAVGELLRITRGQDRDLPGPREASLKAAAGLEYTANVPSQWPPS